MRAVEMPGTCALQVIFYGEDLAKTDAYSKREAKKFDDLCKPGYGTGTYQTQYITASIMTLSDKDTDEYKTIIKVLKAKGWKELGSWPGAHQYEPGEYAMHLWGSSEFTK